MISLSASFGSSCSWILSPNGLLIATGDGRQGKWEATGHIVKLQDSSEEVTMELRDSQKIPVDTTTGNFY